jgi:uncharacterized membrane protein
MVEVVRRADAVDLQRNLTTSESGDLTRRRAAILLNMLALGAMQPPLLLQIGVLNHLPDPPIKGFDSDKVNLSRFAYQMGLPDAALAMASFAANLPLAAFGRSDRARRQPLVPLLAAAKGAVDAAIAARYLYQMPSREKAWCGYCLVAAVTSLAVFVLTVPEAMRALRTLRT